MKNLLFLMLLAMSTSLMSQSSMPILERKISLKISNQKLGKALNIISETAHFNFSYANQVVNTQQMVTIHADNRTVKEVLDELFKQQISYQQIGNHLILQKKMSPKIANKTAQIHQTKYNFIISGYIRNMISGDAISNVSIYERQTLSSTFSGDFGYYKLNITSKNPEINLQFSHSDFKDTVCKITFENAGVINHNINLLSLINPIENEEIEAIDTSYQINFSDSIVQETKVAQKQSKTDMQDLNLGKWLINKYQKLNEKNIVDSFERNWQISFFPPIGSNGKLSSLTTNRLSFNLLAGYNGGLNGVEFGGLVNIIRKDVVGAQFSGLSNLVGGDFKGAQFAGVSNQNLGITNGVQFAGIYNYNNLNSRAMQFAGVGNINRGDLDGFQAAGVFNLAAYKTNAVQLAGVVNVANEINGGQIAGVINIARKVKGFQIGLINIADSAEGMTLGLINIIRNGIHQLEINQNENNMLGLAFRSGTRKLHSIIAVNSEMLIGSRSSLLAYGFGLGSNIKISKPLNLNIGILSQQLSNNFDSENLKLHSRLFVSTEWTFFKGLSIFAGATINHLIADINDVDYQSKLKNYGSTPFLRIEGNYPQHAWLGYQFGVRLF
ncbi:MAG: STN and carboxypeptidase regulatory-like domain-containing protein [Bacteroidota bacterium]|nr:STN and carboxypeptidase regulatory-like domain-containing protein [Bacteroidota bacterium]